MPNYKKCCCCTRQIVGYTVHTKDKYCCNMPATIMGLGKYCCKECSQDLDENGLFPGENGSDF